MLLSFKFYVYLILKYPPNPKYGVGDATPSWTVVPIEIWNILSLNPLRNTDAPKDKKGCFTLDVKFGPTYHCTVFGR
jgi:hypothetical protein